MYIGELKWGVTEARSTARPQPNQLARPAQITSSPAMMSTRRTEVQGPRSFEEVQHSVSLAAQIVCARRAGPAHGSLMMLCAAVPDQRGHGRALQAPRRSAGRECALHAPLEARGPVPGCSGQAFGRNPGHTCAHLHRREPISQSQHLNKTNARTEIGGMPV